MSGLSCGARAPERVDSVVAAHGLSRPVAYGILVPSWHMGSYFPERGIEPASPALQDGFLTTGPPGKSLSRVSSYPCGSFMSHCAFAHANSSTWNAFLLCF